MSDAGSAEPSYLGMPSSTSAGPYLGGLDMWARSPDFQIEYPSSSSSGRYPQGGPYFGSVDDPPPYHPLAVAETFVNLCASVGNALTHLRLQNYVYYSQAWHLALRKTELFDGEIEGWPHGPCQPEVFAAYKRYGHRSIGPAASHKPPPSYLVLFIREVLKAYGGLSPLALMDLAQQEEPWKKSRQGLSPQERGGRIIPRDELMAYYEGKLQKSHV